MNKKYTQILAIFTLSLFANIANAIPTVVAQWDVSDAAGNCSGGPHGLWTNSLNAGSSSCNDYFSFQAGSRLTEYSDGTAVLSATALNPNNILATINIVFGSYSTSQSPIKNPYSVDTSDWYYYQSIESGSIEIQDIDYAIGMHGNYSLQLGLGANDKSANVFGGSVWMDAFGGSYTGGHWDLNMEFTSVPAPPMLFLTLVGLFGVVVRSKLKH